MIGKKAKSNHKSYDFECFISQVQLISYLTLLRYIAESDEKQYIR